MEFAEHRPYEPGDDLRFVDPHAYGRFGRPFVKEFVANEAARLYILVDQSASMGTGAACTKLYRASQLAAALASVARFGRDRVSIASFASGVGPWYVPNDRAPLGRFTLQWLNELQPMGSSDLLKAAMASRSRLLGHGVVAILSDLLHAGATKALRLWGTTQQELLVFHVLGEEDYDPSVLFGRGGRIVDAESNRSIQVPWGHDAQARYTEALRSWQHELRTQVRAIGGRYISVTVEDDVEELVLSRWRKLGVIT